MQGRWEHGRKDKSEGLEIGWGGRQEVSHSSLEENLTHFYSNIKMKSGELRVTQAIVISMEGVVGGRAGKDCLG